MVEQSIVLEQCAPEAQITVFKKIPCSKSNGSVHIVMCLSSE